MRKSSLRSNLRTLGPLWIAIAATGFLVHHSHAQEPSGGVEASTPQGSENRPLKRIFTLRGGSTLRSIARKNEAGTWEYKSRGQWHPLADEMIETVELEKQVLKELRARKRETDKTADSRAALAGWMLSHGLLEEAVKELDRVLAEEPNNSVALAAIDASAHRFRVPAIEYGTEGVEDYSSILTWAAQRSATSRELACAALQRAEDRTALLETLGRALTSTKVGRRSFAPLALARLFPGEKPQELLLRAVLDSSEGVRRTASQALGAAGDPGLVVPVLRAVNSPRPQVREQAIEALGNMGYAAAVVPLVNRLAAMQQSAPGHGVPHSNIFIGRQKAYIQDFDVEVAAFQAVADPSINVLIEGAVLDAGVIGVREVGFAVEKRVTKTALKNLTGANPGSFTRDWMRWWEENRSRYEVASPETER